MSVCLGRINSAYLGIQEGQLGFIFGLTGVGFGVSDFWGIWDFELVKCTENCKWTEEDRREQAADLMKRISKLLHDAKAETLNQLERKPVEMVFEGSALHSWRILTEVL